MVLVQRFERREEQPQDQQRLGCGYRDTQQMVRNAEACEMKHLAQQPSHDRHRDQHDHEDRQETACRRELFVQMQQCARFGTEAGALLHLDEEFAAAGGFLAVFVVVLIAVAIVGRLLRKVFHFAGFGIPDHLLGVAVSAAKTLLILGLLFSAFESLNKDHTLAEEKTLDRSVCYRPMIRLADSLFPLLEWAKEQVSIDEQELWSDNSPER